MAYNLQVQVQVQGKIKTNHNHKLCSNLPIHRSSRRDAVLDRDHPILAFP
jgi:hypothetical protein